MHHLIQTLATKKSFFVQFWPILWQVPAEAFADVNCLWCCYPGEKSYEVCKQYFHDILCFCGENIVVSVSVKFPVQIDFLRDVLNSWCNSMFWTWMDSPSSGVWTCRTLALRSRSLESRSGFWVLAGRDFYPDSATIACLCKFQVHVHHNPVSQDGTSPQHTHTHATPACQNLSHWSDEFCVLSVCKYI